MDFIEKETAANLQLPEMDAIFHRMVWNGLR
jgi:hypothetical protein